MNFICCVLVIWNHAGNSELFLAGSSPAEPLYHFEYVTMQLVVECNIPCFLMLSAYLFYRGFTWEKLWGKWKRRAKTLLAPYLIWNALYYAGYMAADRLPFLDTIVNKGEPLFSLRGALQAIFKFTYNPVFWFMYQLILLVLLAPVLYLILKRVWSGLLFLTLLVIGIFWGIMLPELNLDALLYYSTAAFFALHGKSLVEQPWSAVRAAAGAVIFLTFAVLHYGILGIWNIPAVVLYRLAAPIGLWLMIDEKRLGRVRPWMTCTFFIYAFHFIPVRFINKAAAVFFPGSEAVALVLFLCMPVLAVAVSYQAVRFLRRFTPKTWRLLNGDRG